VYITDQKAKDQGRWGRKLKIVFRTSSLNSPIVSYRIGLP